MSSKPLGSADESSATFVRELLKDDPTYAINFDRIQYDNIDKCWVIVEFQKCEPRQFSLGITPFTSDPNRYYNRAYRKYNRLWELRNILKAKFYVVNYSEQGTEYENEVLLMEVTDLNTNNKPIITLTKTRFNRDSFSDWFRSMNTRGKD